MTTITRTQEHAAGDTPSLSLVLAAKDEACNIPLVYEEITASLQGQSFEIIFVDDGSTDGTYDEMHALFQRDPRITVLRLQKNYGKSAAYMAGFAAAQGDVVATMDTDLQDVPADLMILQRKLAEGYDVVIGWKRTGKSSAVTFVLSRLFNGFIRLVTGMKLHDMNCPLRVMRRDVAKRLVLYGGMFRYIPYIAFKEGFRVAEAPVHNRSRKFGASKFGAGKYVRGLFDFLALYVLLRFSEKPLHLFGGIGSILLMAGCLVDGWLSLRWLAEGISPQEDLPTLLLGVLLMLVGIQLVSIGLLAEMQLSNVLRANREQHFVIRTCLRHTANE